MDQFPLGKGKRVWLIPTTTAASIVCLFTQTPVLLSVDLELLIAFPLPITLLYCTPSTVLSVTFAPFPKHAVELVMGPTVPAKTTHTVILTCMPFIFLFYSSNLI